MRFAPSGRGRVRLTPPAWWPLAAAVVICAGIFFVVRGPSWFSERALCQRTLNRFSKANDRYMSIGLDCMRAAQRRNGARGILVGYLDCFPKLDHQANLIATAVAESGDRCGPLALTRPGARDDSGQFLEDRLEQARGEARLIATEIARMREIRRLPRSQQARAVAERLVPLLRLQR